MLSVENLKQAGANTEEGIKRCAGSEQFYLRIAGMVITNDTFDKLKNSIEENDLDAAFENAHALKGMVGNASLDNLSAPIIEITEQYVKTVIGLTISV